MARPKTANTRVKRRERKNVDKGIAHIKSTFNNTIVSFTDNNGGVISWASSGTVGFKGSKKKTPFAAGSAAEAAGKVAYDAGIRKVEVFVKGIGQGRELAVRSITSTGIEITAINDVTPVPHNGCRPPKRRRI